MARLKRRTHKVEQEQKKPKPKKKKKGGFRSVDSYRAKSPEAKRRQLEGLTKGMIKKWAGKAKQPAHFYQPMHSYFRTHPVDFIREHFRIPTPHGSKCIELEPFQEEILKGIFEVDKETGLRKHTLALVGMPKKNGKSTLAAAIALWFLCHGEEYGEIFIVANSREQASWVVWQKLKTAIELHPKLRKENFIDLQTENATCAITNTTVKVLSYNFRTVAGSNPSLVIFDELWGYEELPSCSGRKLFAELTTVPTRKEPLTLIVTYAGYDEDSLLWDLYQAGLRVRDKKPGYDKKMYFYWSHENQASWITKEYLETQRKRLPKNTYLRLHENRWTTSESSFIDIEDWKKCQPRGMKPLLPDKRTQICIGVDVSISGDTTAVVACTKRENRVQLVHHRIWKPSKKHRMDFERDVEAYILQLNDWFSIRRVLYDPYQFHRSATTLKRKGIHMEEYPQTLDRLVKMSQNLFDLVRNEQLVVYYDKEIQQQVQNAKAKQTPRGFRIVKGQSNKKIDFVIALAMAALGATEMQEDQGRPRIRVMDFTEDMREEAIWEPVEPHGMWV